MSQFLIVSRLDQLAEHKKISEEYGVGFEINDFFAPSVLDDEQRQEALIAQYMKAGIPAGSTMHGAFLDVAVFSEDEKICAVSQLRMQQSMEIARKLGVKGVVFHTNYNPYLPSQAYKEHFITTTCAYLEKLLITYSDIEIYVENMFDNAPDILEDISKRLCRYENYGVCLDWAHVNVYGCPCVPEGTGDAAIQRRAQQEAWVQSLQKYVKHLHINDNDLRDDLHLPLGTGRLDWQQFAAYHKAYFQGCTTLIETNRPADQRKSLDYLRNTLGLL